MRRVLLLHLDGKLPKVPWDRWPAAGYRPERLGTAVALANASELG